MSMRNPFAILGIPSDADDETINQSYLDKVRECPPDRDPQQFQQIHAAYQAIKNKRARMKHALFHVAEIDHNTIAQALQSNIKPGRPDQAVFQKTLQECLMKESESCREV